MLVLAALCLFSGRSMGQVISGYFQGQNIYPSVDNAGVPYYPNRLDSQHSNAAARLTYLIYAFARIQGSACALNDSWGETLKPFDQQSMAVMGQKDSDANSGVTLEGIFHQLQLLKSYNPSLRILISIGGSTAGTAFQTAASDANRSLFVKSCVDLFINGKYGLPQNYPNIFDGVDVEWEFPGPGMSNDNTKTDQQNFVALLQEFRNQLGANRILTAATGVSPNQYQLTTPPQFQSLLSQIAPSLNYFNLMTYDYSYAATTGFNAPLFTTPNPLGRVGANNTVAPNNIDSSLQYYIGAGIPPRQLVLGLPFYGKEWTGVSGGDRGLFQPGVGFDSIPYSQIYPGFTRYCDAGSRTAACPSDWGSPLSAAPSAGSQEVWVLNGQAFISFDDAGSIAAKVKYAQSRQLAGVMAWDITMDDAQETLLNTVLNDLVPAPLQFIPLVSPCRIVDTRTQTGSFGGPEIAANSTRTFALPSGSCGIPATASAYALNVTVVPDASLSYLTVWPAGAPQPFVSTVNSDGRVKANAAIIPAGSSGGVSVYATNNTQLILDVNGYFVQTGVSPSSLAFHTLAPCRLVDTRSASAFSGTTFRAGETRTYPLVNNTSGCAIPSSAQAYSLNYTVVPKQTLGYLTTWPSTQSQPLVSTLNSPTGTVVANAAIVPAGNAPGDPVSVYVTDATDLIIDINGYFALPSASDANAASAPLSMYNLTPCRVLDTRNNGGNGFNGALLVNVVGSNCGVPPAAQAFVFNATVVPPSSLGFLTMWPHGQAQPTVSTLNATNGAVTSNMAIVPTTDGSISAFASNPTQLVLDISSYFAR